jgi:hypothetical protein
MHKLDRRSQRVAAPQEAAGKLTVVYQPIAELTPDPKNPRLHSRRQVRQIARSIETFGFNVPILVDRDHKVIAGHGRLLAARELGWSEVPTIQLEHLTEASSTRWEPRLDDLRSDFEGAGLLTSCRTWGSLRKRGRFRAGARCLPL